MGSTRTGRTLKQEAALSVDGRDVSAWDIRSIAKEAFLWGMHPVAIYHRRYMHAQNEKSPLYVGAGRLRWEREIRKASRDTTLANATTFYGVGFFDLSTSPVVVIAPDIRDRYWSIHVHDNYARWWHMLGSQFDKPGPVRRLLVGPNWNGAYPGDFMGAEIAHSPSDFAGVVAQVARLNGTPDELETVHAIQDRITIVSLDQWIAGGRRALRAEDVTATRASYPTYPRMARVREPGQLKGVEFLRWVSLVLNDPSFTKQTDGRREFSAFKRFELLGLKAGQAFAPRSLTRTQKAAIEAGIEDARNDVLACNSGRGGIDMKGWSLGSDLGYRDTDWLQRARYGLCSVLGPDPSRSHTRALRDADCAGRALTGADRYTISFDLTDMPPVTEFWELVLYDSEGFFYDNPIGRYSINSYMLKQGQLHTGNDSLVVYVQHEAPSDPEQRRNWLPAPESSFRFVTRFYGPYGALIDGSYNMPGVVRSMS